MTTRILFPMVWLIICGSIPLRADEPDAGTDAIRAAIERALPLIETSAIEFTKHRDCFSCHHQALPVLTLTMTGRRGFEPRTETLASQTAWTAQFLKRNQDRYREGKGQGGQVDTAGYALWTLMTGEYPPDELTSAVVHYLLTRNADREPWSHVSNRPPTEASDFTTTFLAVQALQHYAAGEQREAADLRINKAKAWILKSEGKDTEDRVFRLRGLVLCKAENDVVTAAARELLATQREDGGWGQLDDQPSDAYATGSVLATLHQAGMLTAEDEAYRRGIKWLLDAQQEDGSWHVATRSKPIQEYFESGFPHGPDQFISMAATCWATMALALALEDA